MSVAEDPPSAPPINPALAGRIGSQAHLSTARLLDLNCGLRNTDPVQVQMWQLHTEPGFQWRRDPDGISYAFRLASRVTPQSDTELVVFQCDIVFELKFLLDDAGDYSDDECQAFGSTSGLFAAWPYLREVLQSTSMRCGLPPIVLDVIRLNFEAPEVVRP